jgi:DNA-binding NarL/FixJ family response regulator
MVLPPSSPSVMNQMGMRLEADDLPILGMILNGTPRREIAEVLSLSEKELGNRTAAILARVKAPDAV